MNRSVIELIKLIKIFSLYSNGKSFNNLKERKFLKIFLVCVVFCLQMKGYFLTDTSDRV